MHCWQILPHTWGNQPGKGHGYPVSSLGHLSKNSPPPSSSMQSPMVHPCFKSQKEPMGRRKGNVQAGFVATDPGPQWHPEYPLMTRFDPRGLPIFHPDEDILPKSAYVLSNMLRKAASTCRSATRCEVRVWGPWTHTSRIRHLGLQMFP